MERGLGTRGGARGARCLETRSGVRDWKTEGALHRDSSGVFDIGINVIGSVFSLRVGTCNLIAKPCRGRQRDIESNKVRLRFLQKCNEKTTVFIHTLIPPALLNILLRVAL